MNPNFTLYQIRCLISQVHSGKVLEEPKTKELVKLVEELDHWISVGGELPELWEPMIRSEFGE